MFMFSPCVTLSQSERLGGIVACLILFCNTSQLGKTLVLVVFLVVSVLTLCYILGCLERTEFVPMKKLSRREISEAMQSVPLDTVLLGVTSKGEKTLTTKQRAFVEAVAMGDTKAGAYRKAYKSTGKPKTQSNEGQKLAKSPAISAQIDALRLAAEARKYATPAALRSLVIERLTAHAIDEDVKPAQRLRALELLGKVTEIAAFTERREIVKTTNVTDAKAQLLTLLRRAINQTGEIEDVEPVAVSNSVTLKLSADSQATEILGEIVPGMEPSELKQGPGASNDALKQTHPGALPRNARDSNQPPLHSIPHPQSDEKYDSTQKTS